MRTAVFVLILSSGAWAQTTVGGTVRYRDRTYGPTGFTGTVDRVVRQARVEIIRASDGAVLGSDFTDDSGVYSIPGMPNGETVFLRAYAETDPAFATILVRDTPSNNAILTGSSANFVVTSTFNFTMTAFGIAGAFNILDMGVWVVKHLNSLGEGVPPPLHLYWFESSTNGTFFDRNNDRILLLGKFSDPDEYDDDIILHEIGHWVAHHYSKDDTPGGAHTIVDQNDGRLAWSEGWAHYWSSTVRRFAGAGLYPDPDGFVDNFGSGNSYFEIDTPSLSAQTVTALNEVAVANGLWRFTQTTGGQEGLIWLSFKEILTFGLAQVTLEDMRKRLVANLTGPNYSALFDIGGHYESRKVRYYQDADDVPQTNVPPGVAVAAFPFTTTERTIFGVADEDWFTLTLPAGVVNVETMNLKDGADTVLELFDGVGTLLASNDDRVAGDQSSLINFQIQTPGTYRVRVTAFSGAGAIYEHGYYDLKIEASANAIPVIDSFSAGPTSGTAPLRVTFTIAAHDPDGSVHSFAWDFDGDGKTDLVSIEGGNVSHTYDKPGTYLAKVRVLDNGDRSAFATAEVAVGGPSAAVSLDASFSSLTAPATVTYTTNVSGIVPVAYEWDFDADGILDAASVVSNSATATYRIATSFIARSYVIDREGRRFRADGPALVISPGAAPPTITSFTSTAASGTIPLSVVLSVVAAGATRIEWDVDGDGRFDLDSGATSAILQQYQRVGTFTAMVRVTNAAGTSSTRTTTISTSQTGVAGWMVEPREGDKISGTSVTLSAEAVPKGRVKKVQFQFRTNFPVGPWTDIGGPIFSDGTKFSVQWDVSSFTAFAAFDVRILVDDTASSGDSENTVTIDPVSFDIAESGGVKDRLIRSARAIVCRTAAGVELEVPYDALASPATVLRMEPGPAFAPNGAALGGVQVGPSVRVSGAATFRNAFVIRLPFPAGFDASRLEIFRFDEQAGVWRRDFASTARTDERLVETRSTSTGVFAIFVVTGDGDGGSSFCLGSVRTLRPSLAFPVGIGILVLWSIFWRRWRSSPSSSSPTSSSGAPRS